MALVCSLAVPVARRREQCVAVCNRVIPAAALLPKPELCVHVLRQATPTCAPTHREWWLKAQYHFPHTSSPAHPLLRDVLCPSGLLLFLCLPGHTGASCLCSFGCSTQWGLQGDHNQPSSARHFSNTPSCCRAVYGCMQCLDLQGSCWLKSLVFQGITPVVPWSGRV